MVYFLQSYFYKISIRYDSLKSVRNNFGEQGSRLSGFGLWDSPKLLFMD